MASVLAIANHKGGVGKSTTAANLAALAALSGQRTLVLDLDGQGSVSISLGVGPDELDGGMAEVFLDGAGLGSVIRRTEIDKLDLATGSLRLSLADLQLAFREHRVMLLEQALQPLREHYDFIVLDLPPALGLVSLNALVAADYYLVPVPPAYLDAAGIRSLTYALDNLQALPGVSGVAGCLGYVVTAMDRRPNNAIRAMVDLLRTAKGEKVCETIIPLNTAVMQAPSFGAPVVTWAPETVGAHAYRDLYVEVLGRIQKAAAAEVGR